MPATAPTQRHLAPAARAAGAPRRAAAGGWAQLRDSPCTWHPSVLLRHLLCRARCAAACRRRRREEGGDEGFTGWGKPGEAEEEAAPDKEVEPEFGLSGALAAETNKVK